MNPLHEVRAVSDIPDDRMLHLNRFFRTLMLCACCAMPFFSFAQKGGKVDGSRLTEAQQWANTALFVDAVKERLNENYDLAEEMLHRVIATEPSHDAAHYEMALLLINKGQIRAALQEAVEAAKYQPDNLWYQLLLGELYGQTGQHERAEACWRLLSEKRPDNLEYLNNYAYSLTQQEKLKEAVRVYGIMQRQLGANEELLETKKNLWLFMKKPDEAVAELEPLMEANPGETRYYLEAAQIYLIFKKNKKALACLEKAQQIDSTDGQLQMMLYDMYARSKKQDKAYECLKRVIGNPSVPMDAKRKVMSVYYQSVQQDPSYFKEVYPLLDLLVEAHPESAECRSLRADFLLLQQRYSDALPDLEKAISLDSTKSLAWQYYITILLQQNRPLEAAKAGARASRMFPTQAIPYFAMAAGAMEVQDYDSAVSLLQEALRYVSDNLMFQSDIYRMMARAYTELGSYSKAEEAEAKRAECQRQAEEIKASNQPKKKK